MKHTVKSAVPAYQLKENRVGYDFQDISYKIRSNMVVDDELYIFYNIVRILQKIVPILWD